MSKMEECCKKRKTMKNEKKIERHIRHIEALNIAYEKIIVILEKDMDKIKDDDGEETITLKDGQIKIFSEGTLKASETANALLHQIGQKEDELERLRTPDEEETETTITTVKKIKEKSSLNQHLK